jgi:hypothetical protein
MQPNQVQTDKDALLLIAQRLQELLLPLANIAQSLANIQTELRLKGK